MTPQTVMFAFFCFWRATNIFYIDVLTYNVLIDGYGKRGDIVTMLELFEEMKNSDLKPDHITFNSLMSHLFELGSFTLNIII